MNQKVVVYIILSAILLYLYYKRGDLAVFAAFVVVVAGTLIFRSGNASAREGMSIGGVGGGDKECAKLGFTAPKIVKDDIGGSLEKEMNKIKKVADKYWPYDEKGNSNNEDEKKSIQEFIGVFFKEAEKMKEDDDGKKNSNSFYEISLGLYNQVNNPDKSKRQKIKIDAINISSELTKPLISGGNVLLKLLNDVGKSNKIKDAGAKKLANYLTCLCKHWIAIYKKLEEVVSGSGGGGGDDDEEKPKKKKKKETKKKKSKKADEDDDEDADDAEDE